MSVPAHHVPIPSGRRSARSCTASVDRRGLGDSRWNEHSHRVAAISSIRDQQGAFAQPGALDRRCQQVSGELSGAEVLRIRLHDIVACIVSTFVQPAGAMGRALGMQLGGIAGLAAVTRNQGKKRDASEIKTDEGLDKQLGSGRRVTGLTSRRFLMWGNSQLSGKPKGLEAAIPLDGLVSISHQKGRVVTKLVFECADGPGAIMDSSNIGKPEPFIEAYERLAR